MTGVISDFERGVLSPVALGAVFDGARDVAAMEEILARLAPHERERLQEQRDLSDQQAGRETGRIARGGYAHAHHTRTEKQRREQETTARTLTQLLMNAHYRALHEIAMATLHEAAREIDDALIRLTALHADIQAQIEDMKARALRDAEGNLVFIDGEIYRYANGSEVDPVMAATIVRREGVGYPTYDEWRAAHEAAADVEARIEEVEHMRHDLADLDVELNNEEQPPTAERIEEIIEEVEEIKANAAEIAKPTAHDVGGDAPVIDTRPTPSALPAV